MESGIRGGTAENSAKKPAIANAPKTAAQTTTATSAREKTANCRSGVQPVLVNTRRNPTNIQVKTPTTKSINSNVTI